MLFPPSAGDEYKNHPSRHGSIALPVPEVPPPKKCPWGLYASPPPVAMAVVGWFLCFSALFLENRVFFPIRDLRPPKKSELRLFPQSSYAFPGS